MARSARRVVRKLHRKECHARVASSSVREAMSLWLKCSAWARFALRLSPFFYPMGLLKVYLTPTSEPTAVPNI